MADNRETMGFWDKLQKIDRRWIYLVIALAVIVPFFVRMGLPVPVTKEVRDVFDFIDNLGPDGVVCISADYSPSVAAELDPMLDVIIRHCFERKVKVVIMSLLLTGPGLVQPILKKAADDYGAINGIDYTFLGYRYGYSLVIMKMGEDIHKTFGADYYGTNLNDIPMMKNINSYKDINLLIPLTGSGFDPWIIYAQGPYRQDVAAGVTAVMAADSYPYLQSGQIIGLLGGLKGAAEYERLAHDEYKMPFRMATIGMESQSWAHIAIILFIIVGNIAYFSAKKKI